MQLDQRLTGRVVLVTGASRGIGAATARLLGRHGATVAVNYVQNRAAADRVVADISRSGAKAVAYQADVTVEDETNDLVRQASEDLGRVDTLVLNAHGSGNFEPGPILRQDIGTMAELVTGQLRAALLPAQAVLPSMVENKDGVVVAVGTVGARMGVTGFGPAVAAKGALEAVIRTLALEVGAQGVRVNVVAPGYVDTELSAHVPAEVRKAAADQAALRRVTTAEDVAGAILALVSDETRLLTGTYIPVDGGRQLI